MPTAADGPEVLPCNWDEKLRELIVGICLSRSLLLQSIAQTIPGHVRTSENGPACASMNLAELAEIRRAADSGYRRKDLPHWLKEVEKMDFVIRLLVMMAEFAKRGKTPEMRESRERLEETLRSRFARPVQEMTLGRFMRLIAVDFPSPSLAGAVL